MRFIRKLLITLLVLIIVLISILFIIGYTTYASALKEKPLLERVSEITSKENFVKFGDMSDYYRNAVVAVEDHRFYDHGPVDFIAICRAFYTNIKNKKSFKRVVVQLLNKLLKMLFLTKNSLGLENLVRFLLLLIWKKLY